MRKLHRLLPRGLRKFFKEKKETQPYGLIKTFAVEYQGGGVTVFEYPDIIEIHKGEACIRISRRHSVYLQDILDSFNYYFDAVEPIEENGKYFVDYSRPRKHKMKDFALFEVLFPSFAEGYASTAQYLEFAKLNEDSIVLDLGAYSGLTSIQFDMEITKHNPNAKGRVVAVDADSQNIPIIIYNLEQYKHITQREIEYLYAACGEKDGKIEFSSEGNMGASLVSCVGEQRADRIEYVPTMTLSSIAKKYALPKVDFIKCDIEGSELFVFKDTSFFERFSPAIMFEAHYTRLDSTTLTAYPVMEQLARYGYSCTIVSQGEVTVPLVECIRNTKV